jgi:hypothetical protein
MSCEWAVCFIRSDVDGMFQDAGTRTTLSIISLRGHGVRWHPAATAEYVCPRLIHPVASNPVVRCAISRRPLCTTSLTRITTWLCCYLCIAPLAGIMLFLTSRLLGRSKYDCPNEPFNCFVIIAIIVAYNFFVLCLYHIVSCHPQSSTFPALVPMYRKSRVWAYS